MALALLLGLVALATIVMLRLTKAKKWFVRLAALLTCVAIVTAFGVWWVFLRPDVHPYVWVARPAASTAEDFRIDVANTRILMTGTTNTFVPRASTGELFDRMRQLHPATIIEGESAHVIEDNWGFVLYPSDARDGAYTLQAEFVGFASGDTGYDIPFPTRWLIAHDATNWTVQSTCNMECLTAYYQSFTNVKPVANGFEVTTSQGVFLVISDENGYLIVKK